MIINSHKFLNKTSCKNLKSFPLLDEEAMSKHSDEEKDNLNDINTNFILATRYNNTNFNLWHCYAMFNYKLYKSLLNYKNEEKNNGPKYCVDARISLLYKRSGKPWKWTKFF